MPPISCAARWRPAPPPRRTSAGSWSSASAHRARRRAAARARARRRAAPTRAAGGRRRPAARRRRRSARRGTRPPRAPRRAGRRRDRPGGVAGEAVRERDERGGVLERGLASSARISTVPEPRVRAQLPPEPRVVGHVGRAGEQRAPSRRSPRSRASRAARPSAASRASSPRAPRRGPVSRPWRNGELAASACSSGRWRRSPLKARIAVSASGIPTWMCSPADRRRDRVAEQVADALVALLVGDLGVALGRRRMRARAEQPGAGRDDGAPQPAERRRPPRRRWRRRR